MTAKRDTGRQRRVNQNRSARDALEVRRQAAANKAEPAPDPVKPGRRASRAQAAPVVPAKPRAARLAGSRWSGSPPPSVPDNAPAASGILARTQQLAGGRQMLAGFVLVVAGTPLAAFLPFFREKGSKHTQSLVALAGARSLILLLLPLLIAVVPLVTLNHPRRRMAWNIAAFMLGLWVLSSGLLPFYVFGLGAMVWGIMKASRAEGPVGRGAGLFGRGRAPRGDAATTVEVDGAEAGTDPADD